MCERASQVIDLLRPSRCQYDPAGCKGPTRQDVRPNQILATNATSEAASIFPFYHNLERCSIYSFPRSLTTFAWGSRLAAHVRFLIFIKKKKLLVWECTRTRKEASTIQRRAAVVNESASRCSASCETLQTVAVVFNSSLYKLGCGGGYVQQWLNYSNWATRSASPIRQLYDYPVINLSNCS